MKFSADYVNLCLQWRHLFKSFNARYGDWYGNQSARKVLVYTDPGPTPFGEENFFYFPDLNDLVRMIHGQAAFLQKTDNPSVSINLSAMETGRWNLEIVLKESVTEILDAESPHGALLQGLQQLSALGH